MLGAVGLFEDSGQLLRWMISGPEIAHWVSEFEASLPYHQQGNGFECRHHEQTSSHEQRFSTKVLSIGNPFLGRSEDFLVLNTWTIVNKKVVNTVNLIETLGSEQFRNFVEIRPKSSKKVCLIPSEKKKLIIFSQETTKRTSYNQVATPKKAFNCSPNCIFPVKLEMVICINFFLMKITLRSEIKSDLLTCL